MDHACPGGDGLCPVSVKHREKRCDREIRKNRIQIIERKTKTEAESTSDGSIRLLHGRHSRASANSDASPHPQGRCDRGEPGCGGEAWPRLCAPPAAPSPRAGEGGAASSRDGRGQGGLPQGCRRLERREPFQLVTGAALPCLPLPSSCGSVGFSRT